MSDARLDRARKGSSQAFAQLVSEHQQAVRLFLRRLVSVPEDADDLAQESFVTAWQKLDALEQGVSFRTFVCGIAYRKALNARRQRMRHSTRDTQWHDLQPDRTRPEHETRLSLEVALKQLPLDQRAAVCLCVAENHSHAEAAAILGLPIGTVKSHIKRGRSHLCQLLGVPDHEQ
ncbi:RNA polymerase sigma factor [Asticcacaulis tiandongensis]|uniref:RNA polymerase sigma factor n=1 Tax=Asticcacaulis tiandongensis TaxID=2565365 RepID=UPI00112DB598|nr:RNA polymerase sigma factor [Asticcacaulis tiandongensis]